MDSRKATKFTKTAYIKEKSLLRRRLGAIQPSSYLPSAQCASLDLAPWTKGFLYLTNSHSFDCPVAEASLGQFPQLLLIRISFLFNFQLTNKKY
jgi:hypothetical protein